MSVEKLSDISKVLIEQYPFTQIPNNVINHIKDNDAFRLYAYLISKARDWKVIKEYAAKECGIGEKKARECWSYFARCGLIEYRTEKDEKGKIIRHDLIVLIGLKFDKDVPFKPVDKSTRAKTASVEKTHIGKNPLSGQSTRVDFAPLLNKEVTNKEKTKNKESPASKKRSPLPDDFVFDEENQKLCKEKRLDPKLVRDKFINHVKAYAKKVVDWQAEAKLWIIRERPANPTNVANPKNEAKSTVMEYGPGHPTWEFNQEWERKKLDKGMSHGRNSTRGASL
jgi:hypothetical protein